MEAVKTSFTNHPRKWDYAVILTLVAMLAASASYIANSEMTNHNADTHAHPAMQEQLDNVHANQIRQYIMQLDKELCTDPNNVYLRRELAEQMAKYETLTGVRFPSELLRCSTRRRSE